VVLTDIARPRDRGGLTGFANDDVIYPVVLCGGSGTRLWPRSRKQAPKPFLPLVGEETPVRGDARALRRSRQFAAAGGGHRVGHRTHVEAQAARFPGRRRSSSRWRRTPPRRSRSRASPARGRDHAGVPERPPHRRHRRLPRRRRAAARLAADDWLVSFGITPDRARDRLRLHPPRRAAAGGFQVERFVEKPDLATAERFLADGQLQLERRHLRVPAPARSSTSSRGTGRSSPRRSREAVARGTRTARRSIPTRGAFAAIEPESVDYAVMENTTRAAVVPVRWAGRTSATGSACATRARRRHGNRTRGDVELVDCRNVLAETDGPRISVIGLEDIAVVVDGDEVLVTTMAGRRKSASWRGGQPVGRAGGSHVGSRGHDRADHPAGAGAGVRAGGDRQHHEHPLDPARRA
jgi:mannose-1-phosphate guanylyltransferase